jgi:hypothetical protein
LQFKLKIEIDKFGNREWLQKQYVSDPQIAETAAIPVDPKGRDHPDFRVEPKVVAAVDPDDVLRSEEFS